MEQQNKKCSYQEHNDINANYFCQECKVYMCNKCENFHTKLVKVHHIYNLEKDKDEIFSIFCKEKEHLEILDFYWKNHNQLCCTSCICKIKGKKYGQHAKCNITFIEEIKDEKKNKLNENIKILEEISTNIKESLEKIKKVYEKINSNKEELKLKVQKIFTKIRNALNEREDELLLEIDKQYDIIYFNEQFIKDSEKIQNKIITSLEKGKKIDKEWNEPDKLYSLLNDCINIENNINHINIINEKINKFNNLDDYKLTFMPEEENEINKTLEIIKKFGFIEMAEFYGSKIINHNNEYINLLKSWINSDKNIKTKLLYRLSDNGENFSNFHSCCDNKGPTVILFYLNDGNKNGIYTPSSWDSSSWDKYDKETFIFSLNKNKKCKKINDKQSIYCYKDHGPYVYDFGCGNSCGSTKKIVYYSSTNNKFENASLILSSDKDKQYYDLLEVEVFEII